MEGKKVPEIKPANILFLSKVWGGHIVLSLAVAFLIFPYYTAFSGWEKDVNLVAVICMIIFGYFTEQTKYFILNFVVAVGFAAWCLAKIVVAQEDVSALLIIVVPIFITVGGYVIGSLITEERYKRVFTKLNLFSFPALLICASFNNYGMAVAICFGILIIRLAMFGVRNMPYYIGKNDKDCAAHFLREFVLIIWLFSLSVNLASH